MKTYEQMWNSYVNDVLYKAGDMVGKPRPTEDEMRETSMTFFAGAHLMFDTLTSPELMNLGKERGSEAISALDDEMEEIAEKRIAETLRRLLAVKSKLAVHG